MARHRGRVIVQKVDITGKKIKNLAAWIIANPGARYFDSHVEWEVWDYLDTSGIEHQSQVTLNLYPTVKTEEFQQPRQTKKAKKEGRNEREIKEVTQKSINYTPDYYLPEFDTHIEVKGYADELFKMRWKLFKLKGYNGFIVYSLKEFIELYDKLKINSSLSAKQ